MLRATVSGSFHRHMSAITAAVYELASLSVRVLSPADPRVVAAQGEFLFVASDRVRSVRLVQDRHMDCIRASSFLWLVCPDGYVGVSAAMEINEAKNAGVPVFATRAPNESTVREYVSTVSSLTEAVSKAKALARPARTEGILIDPHASLQEAHAILERVDSLLTRNNPLEDQASSVYSNLTNLQAKLGPRTYIH
jgi:hypothetical protein